MTPGTTKWWSALRHGGLLIAPSRFGLLRTSEPEPISSLLAERLRGEVIRLGTQHAAAQREFLDTVLEHVCDLQGQDGARWLKGNDVPAAWSRRGATGETLKPRRLWLGPNGGALPVFVDHEPRLGVGRGRRSVSRVLEWLRASDSRIALLTNHAQFRLIYAGADYDAWAEWDVSLWFEEGAPSPQVEALRWLIGRQAVASPAPGKRCTLVEAIEESRKGQSELSASLGERVRRAVEHLIQAYGGRLAVLPADVSTRDIYVAATRVAMRMVVVLFAEARELLPRDNPLYEGSYGLQALRAHLDRATGASRQRRTLHGGAWPRILGMFRLVHGGSHHPELLIRRYGGGLFASGSAGAEDPVDRALAVFEDPEHGPNDEIVARILDLLCRTEMRVRIGNGFRDISAPVDFSDLSSEYIGILYEGLLDYELRRAAPEDPLIFLDLGDQPVLPLSRLEGMTDAEIKGLVEKVKKRRKAVAGGEDEQEGDGADEEPDDDDQEDIEAIAPEAVEGALDERPDLNEEATEEDEPETEDDRAFVIDQRAHEWAVRAVKAGGLVAKARSKRPEVVAKYEEQVAVAARQLIIRVVQPGEWFLVLWGGTRKGSGTFYTRPQLAVPTVHRTLRPLAYDPPDSGDEALVAEWTPKMPEAILSLKVCDPAVGSGSFLVAALRFLTEALWRSLLHARWLIEEGDRFIVTATGKEPPPWFAECVRDLPVTAGEAESHIRARLRRIVVERCLYGVDLDRVAIELARLSLWVETMDRSLPFEFLDHRLKVGNALVGCWFDRFRDYPAMAWMREGGDADHENFVHHSRSYIATRGKNKGQEQRAGDVWTFAIKQWREERVKPALTNWIIGQGSLLREIDGRAPEALHDEAVELLGRMEAISLYESDERARFYREDVQQHGAFRSLVRAFDTWCALWFWPPDDLESAPMPAVFGEPGPQALAMVQHLKEVHRFFHWELEFADVFAAPGAGFDAIVGNPPWEIQKPNSKEFFSNIDPLYRTYTKPIALAKQKERFRADPVNETDWVSYAARHKALSNWSKHAASPFGDPADGGESWAIESGQSTLHASWRAKRHAGRGYADAHHPFRHQGSADTNTYKMFLETAHALLKGGGRLGMIVPSGVYTDKGSTALRELFLEHCQWEWLFVFENRDKIFDIDGRFKFGPLILIKGGATEGIRTAFMQRDLRDWQDADRHVIRYPKRQIERFSPVTRAIMEIGTRRDLDVLDKIFSAGTTLKSLGVAFSRELHKTYDSKILVPREKVDRSISASDFRSGNARISLFSAGLVPVWEGRNCWFDSWPVEPVLYAKVEDVKRFLSEIDRVGLRRVSSSTNERTLVPCLVPAKVPTLYTILVAPPVERDHLCLLWAIISSFVVDYAARMAVTASLIASQIEGLPTPPPDKQEPLIQAAKRLFAADSVLLRIGARVALDAIVASAYGLSVAAMAWILRDCDHPAELSCDSKFARGLDPKGFWRVDKEKQPELRHTVLTLVAFRDLENKISEMGGNHEMGVAAFCGQNDGVGWLPPRTLRLADYELGQDERARFPQEVQSQLASAQGDIRPEAFAFLGSGIALPGATDATHSGPSAPASAESGSAQRRLFPSECTLFGDKTEDPV